MTMTKEQQQEIFDRVAVHLLTQNKKSERPVSAQCLYRGPFDLKCAIGALIKDEVYSHDLEGHRANIFTVRKALKRSGVPVDVESEEDAKFLTDLQDIHDLWEVTMWPRMLRETAQMYGLNADKVKDKVKVHNDNPQS